MSKKKFILAISPHKLYTKIAVINLRGDMVISSKVPFYNSDKKKLYSQRDFRIGDIIDTLKQYGISLGEFICIVGTGGILRPMPGGTYLITPKILEDIRLSYSGEHITNLGALIAYGIAKKANIKAYMVDSMTVDEMSDEARMTGLPSIQRVAISYALSMKQSARIVADRINKVFNDSSYIVCQLNEEVSTIALRNGKIIDAMNFYDEGSFSVRTCGEIPPLKLAKLALDYNGDYKSFYNELYMQSGLSQYISGNDDDKLYKILHDEGLIYEEEKIFKAFCYNVAKNIGAMAAALNFKLDRIIFTGDLCQSEFIMNNIKKYIQFICPIEIIMGNFEFEAMFNNVKKILDNEVEPKIYENEV